MRRLRGSGKGEVENEDGSGTEQLRDCSRPSSPRGDGPSLWCGHLRLLESACLYCEEQPVKKDRLSTRSSCLSPRLPSRPSVLPANTPAPQDGAQLALPTWHQLYHWEVTARGVGARLKPAPPKE